MKSPLRSLVHALVAASSLSVLFHGQPAAAVEFAKVKVFGGIPGWRFILTDDEVKLFCGAADFVGSVIAAVPSPVTDAAAAGLQAASAYVSTVNDLGGHRGVRIYISVINPTAPVVLPVLGGDGPAFVGEPTKLADNQTWISVPDGPEGKGADFDNTTGKRIWVNITSIACLVPEGANVEHLYYQIQQGRPGRDAEHAVCGFFQLPEYGHGVTTAHTSPIYAGADLSECCQTGKPAKAFRDFIFMNAERKVYGGFRVIVLNESNGVLVQPLNMQESETEVHPLDTQGHFVMLTSSQHLDRRFVIAAAISSTPPPPPRPPVARLPRRWPRDLDGRRTVDFNVGYQDQFDAGAQWSGFPPSIEIGNPKHTEYVKERGFHVGIAHDGDFLQLHVNRTGRAVAAMWTPPEPGRYRVTVHGFVNPHSNGSTLHLLAGNVDVKAWTLHEGEFEFGDPVVLQVSQTGAALKDAVKFALVGHTDTDPPDEQVLLLRVDFERAGPR